MLDIRYWILELKLELDLVFIESKILNYPLSKTLIFKELRSILNLISHI